MVAQAREASHQFAARLGWPAEARDDLALIVSELVTNACRHAPGPCRLRLEDVCGGIGVEVWDTNPLLPPMDTHRASPLPDTGEVPYGGYGLGIVAQLCHELCGVADPHCGKTVRAVMARPTQCEQHRDEQGANDGAQTREFIFGPAALPGGRRLVPGHRVRPAHPGRHVLQPCSPTPPPPRGRGARQRAGLFDELATSDVVAVLPTS
ncbi:ATP-binding protein [Streptomyces sp. NPDC001635]